MPKGKKTYQSGDSIMKYICEICESEGKYISFKNRTASNLHMKFNHPEAKIEITQLDVLCNHKSNLPIENVIGGHQKKMFTGTRDPR